MIEWIRDAATANPTRRRPSAQKMANFIAEAFADKYEVKFDPDAMISHERRYKKRRYVEARWYVPGWRMEIYKKGAVSFSKAIFKINSTNYDPHMKIAQWITEQLDD